MPINFGGYAFRPTPLSIGGMGEGLDSIIQANQEKARLDQQESQYARTRRDTQSTTAADFAAKRGDEAHKQAMDRYEKQRALVDAATKAAQNGDWNTARALAPRILELGGEASESGDPANPRFRFKSGALPPRAPLDFAGARRDIYGEGGPTTSAPFQVPGFGANGQRNPFEPPAVAGASAAALPPQPLQNTTNQGPPPAGALPSPSGTQTPSPDPGPPPGAAVDGPRTPPPGAVWMPPTAPEPPAPPTPPVDTSAMSPEEKQLSAELAAAGDAAVAGVTGAAPAPPAAEAPQAAQPGSPQLTGPNPFTPLALDPYTIDTQQVTASNRLRLDPMLRGIVDATPSRNRDQVKAFTDQLGELRLNPTDTLTAARPYFEQLAGMYRGEVAAEGQAGRAEAMQAQRESIQDDKDRRDARSVANRVIENERLKDIKKNLSAGREASALIEDAGKNPQVANSLIESLFRMKNTGVMTDKDFDRTKEGVRNLWGRLKNGTLQQLFQEKGFNPDMVADLRELVDIMTRTSRESMGVARDSLYRAWKTAPTKTHRQVYDESIRIFFPPEYLPKEFLESWENGNGGVPTVAPEDEQAAMERMAAEEGNLGVVDVPAGAHPSAPAMPPEPRDRKPGAGSRAGDKPPRNPPKARSKKDPKQMTNEEIAEELKKLEEEANAP